VAVLGGVGWLLSTQFRERRAAREREEHRDDPIVAPSRVEHTDLGVVVRLDSVELLRAGLRVVALQGVRAAPQALLNAVVIADSARIAIVRAPISGRLDVADGAQWPEIGSPVAAGVPLAQIGDARPVPTPRAGIVTQVGARPGELVQAGQLLLAISDLSAPLIRVAWSDAAPGTAPERVMVQDLDGQHAEIAARRVGPAPEVDPLTQGPAWYYRLSRGWPGLAIGLPLVVRVPMSAGATGAVAIPPEAAVQWDGLLWAYVEQEPGAFSRVRVETDRPLERGWAVTRGFQPGDRVVTRGAEQLLSEEFRARVTVGEEVGE
jgi:biotin carboxyl carrier protein